MTVFYSHKLCRKETQMENNEINFDEIKPYIAPHNPFTLEGHWQPWYDDRRDYNTNAPTYYDYLSNHNEIIRVLTDFSNQHAKSIVALKEYDKTLKAEIDNEISRAQQTEEQISQNVVELDNKTQSSLTTLRNENTTLLPETVKNPQSLHSLSTSWNIHT